MAYILDTNVLITAKREAYAFELCPGFWDWLDGALRTGVVRGLEAVFDELIRLDDDLSEWARERSGYFVPPTAATLTVLGDLFAWADASTHYNQSAKSGFADGADAWLIAHAKAHGDVVVTHERHSNEVGRVKIPTAAAEFGVRVMSPYVMLRSESVRFIRAGA